MVDLLGIQGQTIVKAKVKERVCNANKSGAAGCSYLRSAPWGAGERQWRVCGKHLLKWRE
jgi:hypothetical protein